MMYNCSVESAIVFSACGTLTTRMLSSIQRIFALSCRIGRQRQRPLSAPGSLLHQGRRRLLGGGVVHGIRSTKVSATLDDANGKEAEG